VVVNSGQTVFTYTISDLIAVNVFKFKNDICFKDWLNEFNISPEDLETSSVNVHDNFNEVRLDNFLRNKNPLYSFMYQNYEPMDVDSEDDSDQFDDEVIFITKLRITSCLFVVNYRVCQELWPSYTKILNHYFFSSFSLCSNHLSWKFTKNLRPEPIFGMHLCFPECLRASWCPFLLHKGHDPWHTLYM
jgi:hypothetical protein